MENSLLTKILILMGIILWIFDRFNNTITEYNSPESKIAFSSFLVILLYVALRIFDSILTQIL